MPGYQRCAQSLADWELFDIRNLEDVAHMFHFRSGYCLVLRAKCNRDPNGTGYQAYLYFSVK
jgi:hypothetical protein